MAIPRDPRVFFGSFVATVFVSFLIAYFLFRCSKFEKFDSKKYYDDDAN